MIHLHTSLRYVTFITFDENAIFNEYDKTII